MANSVDPDHTAPSRSSLIRVCTVCSCISVALFRISTVFCLYNLTASTIIRKAFMMKMKNKALDGIRNTVVAFFMDKDFPGYLEYMYCFQ